MKITKEPSIQSLIYMFNYYKSQAKKCFDVYKDILDAYYMFDYYMEMADIYERAILSQL